MKSLEIGIVAIVAVFALVLFSANAVKLYNGCPPGQIIVQSVPTWECVRR